MLSQHYPTVMGLLEWLINLCLYFCVATYRRLRRHQISLRWLQCCAYGGGVLLRSCRLLPADARSLPPHWAPLRPVVDAGFIYAGLGLPVRDDAAARCLTHSCAGCMKMTATDVSGRPQSSLAHACTDLSLRVCVVLHCGCLYVIAVPLPERGSVFDVAYDAKKRGWTPWSQLVPQTEIAAKTEFHEIFVPTVDTVRYAHTLELLLWRGAHVLVTGPTGMLSLYWVSLFVCFFVWCVCVCVCVCVKSFICLCAANCYAGTGKTALIKQRLTSAALPLPAAAFIPLSFSARTTAQQTQDLIESRLDKRRKGVLGPVIGHRAVVCGRSQYARPRTIRCTAAD